MVKTKNMPEGVFLMAERAGFEYHLSCGGARPENKNTPEDSSVFLGGEGGIRISSPLRRRATRKQKHA